METIDDWIEESPVEFDCPGCGREIVGIAMYKLQPHVCGMCYTHPGWVYNIDLEHALDPFGDRDPNKVMMTPEEVECRGEILAAILRFFSHAVHIIEDPGDFIEQSNRYRDRPTLH